MITYQDLKDIFEWYKNDRTHSTPLIMTDETKTHLTEEDILGAIKEEHSVKIGEKTCVVVLTLKNGFEVVGHSACVDPELYDHEVGARFARQRALNKVWELEGYLLQQKLHEAK